MLVRIQSTGSAGAVWINPDHVRAVATVEGSLTAIDVQGAENIHTAEPLDSVVARLNYINTETREHADPHAPPPRPFDN